MTIKRTSHPESNPFVRILGDITPTPVLAPLVRAMKGCIMRRLSNRELDVLERACAALMCRIRNEYLARQGERVLDRWDRRGPFVYTYEEDQHYFEIDHADGVVDHPYRVVDKQQRKTYISEPYCLGGSNLKRLAALEDAGWDVTIAATEALHFPGHTLHVAIRRLAGTVGAKQSTKAMSCASNEACQSV